MQRSGVLHPERKGLLTERAGRPQLRMRERDQHACQTEDERGGMSDEKCASEFHTATISPFWRWYVRPRHVWRRRSALRHSASAAGTSSNGESQYVSGLDG